MDEAERLEAEWDPCPRRTSANVPCQRPRHHVGHCGVDPERVELYRKFIADTRVLAQRMTREELAQAVEFYLIRWRVLRNEYNGR